jgi:hypothetical protein
MDDIFPALTSAFAEVADGGMTVKRNQLGDVYRKADFEQSERPDRGKLLALRNAADAYDAALRTNPKILFIALNQAHMTLAQSTRNVEGWNDRIRLDFHPELSRQIYQ